MSTAFWFVLAVLPALCLGAVVTTPPGCIHNDGKHYPFGEFRPVPCEHCFCPSNGGHTYCAIIDCAMPNCVDAQRNSTQCCAVCPNGHNCYMGKKVIPAGKDVEEAEMICRCPESHFRLGFGQSDIRAVCRMKGPD